MAYKKKYYYKKSISKDEAKKISEEMVEDLSAFMKAGNYKQILKSAGASIYRFSPSNQLYLITQALERGEEVTHLHTFDGWRELGFSVNKGAKSYKITQPKRPQTYEDFYKDLIKSAIEKGNFDEVEEYKKKMEELEKKGKLDEIRYCAYYNELSEFDISQTNGSIDEYYKLFGIYQLDHDKVIENKEKIIKGIDNVLKGIGYEIEFNADLDRETKGVCCYDEKKVKIKDGSDVEIIKVLCHETGHALAHSNPRKDFEGLNALERREVKECEAESIAYIVCSHLGIDTSNYSFSYITGWSGNDISKFINNLEIITGCADKMIKSIDKELGFTQKIETKKEELRNSSKDKTGKTYIDKNDSLEEVINNENDSTNDIEMGE